MPILTSLGSPFSTGKLRPVANQQLEPNELIKIPKGKKLGVTFPYDDADMPVQAVRLVDNATDIGLKAGQIIYAFHKEFLVNESPWNLIKGGKITAKPTLLDSILGRTKKRYAPKMIAGDFHLIVTDDESLPTSRMECRDYKGNYLWEKKCLARGQVADWGLYSGDTPTGLYEIGQLWLADSKDAATCKPYGITCFDLVSIDDGENIVGRAGICLHGGGSALGYPGCNNDYQTLVPTFGCIRMHNADLRETIAPLVDKATRTQNKVFVSVYQL
jgi:hypothetical protein